MTLNPGNMCSRYVGPEKRPDVVALYKFQDPLLEIDMANLLQGLNVVLRIISSWRRKVKMDIFEPHVR